MSLLEFVDLGARCDCVHGYVTRKRGTFCYRFAMRIRTLFLVTGSVLSVGAQFLAAQTIDLPTSKQLIEPVPGQSAAAEQPADVDGGLAGRALRGDGECGIRDLRVEV